ncbi:selenophosphate-dependent tRNA 2-selenouridine synthase [Desulfocucumis palustris]|uniref:Selenophosphate-dependent tRNA 2-selenouridine synthase n=1 Tax=Desulfocucumis palustris TaxID=1898651 RepID=A0A2L2X969_9FIRM|nr:tRNA 2-selenouridine(34) synthase MnmH [Desulfocucumis palustris]GBF32779.1 selenophosphate-dependent tRNA 2-selenouridine synthase [Desulfocucumis palustris]
MAKDIKIEDAFNMPGATLVDVRSENEYNEDTIPGAVNIPLLNNEERAMVGTVYKRENPVKARRLGLNLISPRLPAMLREYEQKASNGRDVVLFCWRGGLRSQFVTYMLDLMGFNVYRVAGGYKSYRKYINSYLERELPHRAVVIHGLTGVGKTEVLKGLEARGLPVLDLEGLACHRGSVFGKIGMPLSPSQKKFESMIVKNFVASAKQGVFVVECESKRLGRLLVPQSVINSMKMGYNILLYASIQERIHRSVKEYVSGSDANMQSLVEAIQSITRYLGNAKADKLVNLLREKKYEDAVEILLLDYYDPLYKYPNGPDSSYHLSVDTGNINRAVDVVAEFVAGLPEYGIPVNGGVRVGNRESPEGSQGSQGSFA